MPQAKITVNSVAGSNTNLPIATLVQLDNVNSGGELTYTWSILDQPPGPTDALSSVAVQNPFFTPKKEGTYLLRLVVNAGLPTEQEDRVVCAVEQIKTLERIPAAGETTEADTVEGWATAMNSLLRRIDALLSDPGIIIGVNTSGGTLTRGQVVHAQASAVLKSGLPGQETVPGFSLATSATLGEVDELLCIVEGTPSGGSSVPGTGTPENMLMKVRYIGRIASQVIANGPVAAGDTIFVNDSGALDADEGTVRRRVGSAMGSGSTVDVWFDGVGGAEIDLTPIDRKYVVYGPLGALPNGVRVDGTNTTFPSGGVPFQLKAQDDTTITMVLRRHTSSGLSIQQWQTESGTVLAEVLVSGKLKLNTGLQLTSGALTLNNGAGGVVLNSGAGGITLQTGGGNIAFGDAAGGQQIGWPNWAFAQIDVNTFRFAQTQSAITNFALTLISEPTLFAWVQMDDNGGTTSYFGSDSNSAGGTVMGSLSNSQVFLVVDGTPYWSIMGTQITALNPGQISFLNDPALAADAANKEYVDQTLLYKNFLINGNFEFWQRSNAAQTQLDNASGIFARSYKNVDRWTLDIFTNVNTSSALVQVSRQSSGLNMSQYCVRVEATPVGGEIGQIGITQEVDRNFVRQLRGQTLRLYMKLRKVAGGYDTTNVIVSLTYGTGSIAEARNKPYTGHTDLISQSFALSTVPTTPTWQEFDFTATGPLPTTATTLGVAIHYVYNDNLAAPNPKLEIAEVMLMPVSPASVGTAVPYSPPVYQWAAGSFEAELELCKFYYQKSYGYDINPGTSLSNPDDGVHTIYGGNAVSNLAEFNLGQHVRFSKEMRHGQPDGTGTLLWPVVKFYTPDGTADHWLFVANGNTAVTDGSGTNGDRVRGRTVKNNTGSTYNPPFGTTVDIVQGHWTADAEI